LQGTSFEIDHVEAWGLGPAVDPEEEKARVQPRQHNTTVREGEVDEDDLMSQLM
jgi:hypothetical protein